MNKNIKEIKKNADLNSYHRTLFFSAADELGVAEGHNQNLWLWKKYRDKCGNIAYVNTVLCSMLETR